MSKNSMATSLNDRCVSRWRLMRLSASCGLSYAWKGEGKTKHGLRE